ncbi:MAG: TraR/DksA family transcriptional regulator [Candidatus Omnitrophota bacterium]|nr:MAG: TraR/DksA family transcriptional regulator [Candidatus Omnitrophota bacterium]
MRKKKTVRKSTKLKSRTKKKLTKKELNYYKEKLLNLREEIFAQMQDLSQETLRRSQKDISGDISGYSLHMADVASDNYEREFSLSLVSNERKIIMEIEEALKRIEDKKYGVCLMCEKNIAKRRLEVIPYARYCKRCQEKLEKESKI